MIKILNGLSSTSRVDVQSKWLLSNDDTSYYEEKKNIKNNDYQFIKLTFTGLTDTQRINNAYLVMHAKNVNENVGVKVIKCDNSYIGTTDDIDFYDIWNIRNSFAYNQEVIENILIEAENQGNANDKEKYFVIDLSNIVKNVNNENNVVMIALNYEFGLNDEFTIVCPKLEAELNLNCYAYVTDITGLNSQYKFDQHYISNFGKYYTNLATGKGIYHSSLLSSKNKKFPITFSLFQNAENNDSKSFFNNKVIPSFQYKFYRSGDNYVIEDPSGLKKYYRPKEAFVNLTVKSSEIEELVKTYQELSEKIELELEQRYKTKSHDADKVLYSTCDNTHIHIKFGIPETTIYLYDRNGNCIKLKNNSNNFTRICEISTSKGDILTYHWNGDLLEKITSSVGEEMVFEYDSNEHIKKVSSSSTNQYVEFEETSSSLRIKVYDCNNENNTPELVNDEIIYFNSNSILTKIKNAITNYYLSFTYDSNRRVTTAGLYESTGQYKSYLTNYEYLIGYTKVTDLNGNYLCYHFDSYGLLRLIMDKNGKSITYNYDEFKNGESKRLTGISKTQSNSRNLIENHSFENDYIFEENSLSWKKSGDINSKIGVINEGVVGNRCLKIEAVNTEKVSIWQDIIIKPGTYQFKGFIKHTELSEVEKSKIKVCISGSYKDGTQEVEPKNIYHEISLETKSNSWYAFNINDIKIEENAYEINLKVFIEIDHVKVDLYLDDIQFVENETYLRNNIIENGYFEKVDSLNNPLGWELLNFDSEDYVVKLSSDSLHSKVLGDSVLKISSKGLDKKNDNTYKNKVIYKKIIIDGKAGDQLVFSVFGKGCVTSNTTFRSFIRLINDNDESIDYIFDFEKNLDNWQMLTRAIIATCNYREVVVGVEYIGSYEVMLDCFQLYKESYGTCFKYDKVGNITEVLSSNGSSSRYVYDEDDKIIEAYNEDGSFYKYVYDEQDPDKENKKLKKILDMFGNILSFTYDDDDRVIEQTLTTSSGEIISKFKTYDDLKNNESSINEFGLKKLFEMDNLNRVVSSSLLTYNTENNEYETYVKMSYLYDEKSQINQLLATFDNISHGNAISYDKFGNVETIECDNGLIYNLTYDKFNKLLSVKINNKCIEEYEYNNINYFDTNLYKKILGSANNNYEFDYDSSNRVSEIKLNGTLIAQISYDENNNVYGLNDLIEKKSIYFTYDLKGQLLKVKSIYDESVNSEEIKYVYNNLGDLQTKVYNINESIRSINYQYGYESNLFNKYNLVDRLLKEFNDEIVYNSPSAKGLNGAKPMVNTCTNYFDEELGIDVINFNDKYDFINYDMDTFNSVDNEKKYNWKIKFQNHKTFYMLIKPTKSFGVVNLLTFGTMKGTLADRSIELKSHLATNGLGQLIYYKDKPNNYIAMSSNSLELDKWNLVGIKFTKNLIEETVRIVVNGQVTDSETIKEDIPSTNYLIIGYQSVLDTSSTTTTSSSYVSTTTSTDLKMPFKVGLMSFGAYDYYQSDFEKIYRESIKYLGDHTTCKVNSTIYYDSYAYKDFDVITLNGSLESSKGLKPYKIPLIDNSYKMDKAKYFTYDEQTNKFVYGCYEKQDSPLIYKLPLINNGTISLRFKISNENKKRQLLLLNKDQENIFDVYIDANNKINFKYCINKDTDVINKWDVNKDSWHHLIIRFKENLLQVYFDSMNKVVYHTNTNVNIENSVLCLANSLDGTLPLNGCIELLAYSHKYEKNTKLNSIISKGQTIVISDDYDSIGRLRVSSINVRDNSYPINFIYNKSRITEQNFWTNSKIYYKYDEIGNISEICNYENNDYNHNYYKYNKLGMLEEETSNDGKKTTYNYCENGNLASKEVFLNDVLLEKEEYVYDINNKDKLSSIINVLTNQTITEISYSQENPFYPDVIKNGTVNNSLTWNGNKLIKFNEYTYKYNSSGIRIEKTVGNMTVKYTLEGNNIIRLSIEKGDLNESIDFTYDSNGKLIGLTTAEGEYFYVRDITGNIIGLVDTYGEFVIRYKYNAWGKILNELPDQDDESFCLAARFNPFMYKGYYYDVETGLFMMGHRYYSPELCRFIQPDDIEYLDPSSINGLNLYCYCMNNPIMYADPSGHFPLFILTALIGAIIGVGITAAVDYIPDKEFDLHWGWYVLGGTIGALVGAVIGMAISYSATGTLTADVRWISAFNKASRGDYSKLVKLSTHNSKSNYVSLGRYYSKTSPKNYINIAKKNRFTYFDMGKYYDVASKKNIAYKINELFLKEQYALGKIFYKTSVDIGNVYAWELEILEGLGAVALPF